MTDALSAQKPLPVQKHKYWRVPYLQYKVIRSEITNTPMCYSLPAGFPAGDQQSVSVELCCFHWTEQKMLQPELPGYESVRLI